MEEVKPFIREVILEDFMSHEYSRMRLKLGLNVILGPNGAGKSSILVGISLALGQSRTERSRKLSELVRYGRDQARVTLLLDNSGRNGRKPLPRLGEIIRLTRVIRRSGDYWFEIDYRRADRLEVVSMLKELGLNPDNMLVIMHQGLIDEFAVLSPQERLQLVEEATGISGYRRRLERALARLENVRAEEREKRKQLEQLRAMEEHWRGLYEKIQERRRLEEGLDGLRSLLAWARIAKLEENLERARERREELEGEVSKLGEEAGRLGDELSRLRSELESVLEEGGKDLRRLVMGMVDQIAYDSAEKAVVEYRASVAREEAHRIGREERRLETELSELKELVGEAERPEKVPSLEEAEGEIKVVEAKIRALGDIPDDVERFYTDIKVRVESVGDRLRQLAENKARLMEEIARRMNVWRREVGRLVDDVNESFRHLLSSIGASGYIKIVYGESPSDAGLEIYVGFKGSNPLLLDPYRQSGGERSTTVTAFLLALQGKVLSPFRAVDEFDVHMDPANRGELFKALHGMFKEDRSTQYLVITPGYPSYVDPDAQYLVVQKVEGISVAEEARIHG